MEVFFINAVAIVATATTIRAIRREGAWVARLVAVTVAAAASLFLMAQQEGPSLSYAAVYAAVVLSLCGVAYVGGNLVLSLYEDYFWLAAWATMNMALTALATWLAVGHLYALGGVPALLGLMLVNLAAVDIRLSYWAGGERLSPTSSGRSAGRFNP